MKQLTRFTRPQLNLWPSFNRWTSLHEELDRLFDFPFGNLAPAAQLANGWSPALDVYEDKDNVTVKVELPGLKKEDIHISLHENTLSISGERKTESKKQEGEVYRSERYFGQFQRAVTLPAPVAADKVKASYEDGILVVTLPKTEEAKPKEISINVS
jgi:HSP20 family protein